MIKILSYIVPRKKRKTFAPVRGVGYDVNGQLLVVESVLSVESGTFVMLVPAERFRR